MMLMMRDAPNIAVSNSRLTPYSLDRIFLGD